ncbi:hypothetical protein ILUMI_26723 [Ignelater luminosus]|uniref:Reverse transcriptase n=1 Tax=Ignelater luminosus TaxID=2038154 RepID=A0A8K0C436_IGNLU|nr:hypothetical protein ILUMI_26723 [Ignelater luminosus]
MNPAHRARANALAVEVRNAITVQRNESWEAKLESLDLADNSLWRMAKVLRHKWSPIPPIHGERGLAHTDEQKVEAFADNLERQCSPNYANADVQHIGRVHRIVRTMLRDQGDREPQILQPASSEEVREHIKATQAKKAPGPDGITNRALKALPNKAIAALTGIINAMLRTRHFPRQ